MFEAGDVVYVKGQDQSLTVMKSDKDKTIVCWFDKLGQAQSTTIANELIEPPRKPMRIPR